MMRKIELLEIRLKRELRKLQTLSLDFSAEGDAAYIEQYRKCKRIKWQITTLESTVYTITAKGKLALQESK